MNGNNILVDTNILLYLLDGQDLAFQLTNNKSIFLSFISEIELLGFKKLTVKEEKQIRNLLNDNIIIDINAPIKQIAIDLRKKYALKIPDLIIAATSVYLDLPLISADAAFKNIEEYKHKLWDHLIMISDFKLLVDSPYPFPERTSIVVKSDKPLPYPKHKIRYRHYGKNLETLIAKAKDMDDDKRKGLAPVVANYMKLVYANWNKETVSDEAIRADLELISGGLLSLDKNIQLDNPTAAAPQRPMGFIPPRKSFGKNNFKKNRSFNGGPGNNNNRFNKRKKSF